MNNRVRSTFLALGVGDAAQMMQMNYEKIELYDLLNVDQRGSMLLQALPSVWLLEANESYGLERPNRGGTFMA